MAERHPDYKIIAINLFFHGGSQLKPPFALKPTEWKLYFDTLLTKEDIEQFSVLGYSMGGRFALTTLKLYGSQIAHFYLVAPDGLVIGNWYRFATSSKLQRMLFKSMLASYPIFLAIAKFLSNIGVLNKGLLKFAQTHLSSKEERRRVYQSWICFRRLSLTPFEFDKITRKHNIKAEIVLGNYDRVIPIKRIEPTLISSKLLTLKKVDVTHHKLFYYDFLDTQ